MNNEKKISLNVLSDNSCLIHYDEPNVPIYIRREHIADYLGYRAQCHWHEDVEFVLVITGEMYYYVNGVRILLSAGNGILVNSCALHYGYQKDAFECEFFCLIFHPSLLAANSAIYDRYTVPFCSDHCLSFIKLLKGCDDNILQKIPEIWKIKDAGEKGYQLKIMGLLYFIWNDVIRKEAVRESYSAPVLADALTLHKMIAYIHDHYQKTITLSGIAHSGNISKSKCCSIFRTQLHQAPFKFLNEYRLSRSAALLLSTSLSVTEIAMQCGFNQAGYYSRKFIQSFGCSPTQYRKKLLCGQ